MDELTRRRLEHNEQLFRAVNDQIEDAARPARSAAFVCECCDADCDERIELGLDEYERIRASGRYFLVPGHERDDLETVVDRRERHLVVEKR